MRWLDILLGRSRPVKSKLENLIAVSTAQITMETSLNLKPAEQAGIVFRPVTNSQFVATEADLKGILEIGGKETGTNIRLQRDDFGFQWVVLSDPQFEDLVTTIHMTSLTLQEQGFGDQLLAAVFKFREDERSVYWIYNYKRGTFYPFVPSGRERERDNATELRLRSVMERELPIEQEIERWYPLWGMPF